MPKLPSWIKSRTVVLLAAATLLVIFAVVAFTLAFTGEGREPGTPTGPDSSVVLTVEQALAAEEDQDIKVRGHLVSSGGTMVLASALLESLPPQAGGSTIPLSGLKLTDIVGLSTTSGQTGVADVTWSDFPLVLEGVVVAGVLEVRVVPDVDQTSLGDVKVRFSPVTEPISSGDDVWWAMDVTNNGRSSVDLTFSDGRLGDLTLDQGDSELYKWSAGKVFDQAIRTVTLGPGRSFPVVLNDTLTVPAGTYDVTAWVTAMVGPEDTAAALPTITTTLVIH
jgi:hypothetical protein